MKKHALKVMLLLAAFSFLSLGVMEESAHARAGGSRSMGSRGARSYARPGTNYSQPSAMPGASRPAMPGGFSQPQSGGFLRSMAGGIAGGLLGGMLFRSMGFAGGGMGMGSGGIGLFEIILLAGIGYLIYRYVKNRRVPVPAGGYDRGYQERRDYQQERVIPISSYQVAEPANDGVETGLSQIRQMDPYFDENRFNDSVMDLFFKVQGAWMNRDLAPAAAILTDEMRRNLQEDVERLLREKRINRLENIAVRKVEISEAWQEAGQDYLTTLIYANLLDYTTDETGAVVSGSKSEPVKFEEYWTFTRPVGNNPWKLSGIDQK